MDEAPMFDADALFDEDYLWFMQDRLRADVSDADAGTIARLTGLGPGTAVLDLACGHGRIANRLAALGASVTGLDASARFLDLARQDAQAKGLNVEYLQGDMRDLPWTGRFDVVVNWFTAFGYFDDPGNRQVLAAVHRVLKPGGTFLLELPNTFSVLRGFQEASVQERGSDRLIEQRSFDPLTSRVVVERIVVRGERIRRFPFFVRIFSYTELRDWLVAAGFSHVDAVDEQGAPLVAGSARMIVVARR